MADIELDNIGEDVTDQRERAEEAERAEEEETSLKKKPTLIMITYELGLVRGHLLKARLE